MYEKSERTALIGIAEIRNVFAHKLTIHSFDTKDNGLDRGLEKLTLHRDMQNILRHFGKGIPSTT